MHAPTHAIVNSSGSAVKVGTGSELLPLLGTKEYSYDRGFQILPIEKVNSKQDGATVSAVTVDRVERQVSALKEFSKKHGLETGWLLPKTVVPLGTRVLELGDSNFRESRASHENKPLFVASLRGLASAVEAEERVDVCVQVNRMIMTEHGTLRDKEKTESHGVWIERHGFQQLLNRCNDVLPSTIKLFDQFFKKKQFDRAAKLFNEQIADLPNDVAAKLRLRKGQGAKSLYATVSEGYAAFDADKIAHVCVEAFEKYNLRGEVIYNPETTTFRGTGSFHAEKIVDLGAGDIFQGAIWVQSGDAANAAFRGGIAVWRNECKNFIILSEERVQTVSVRHSAGFEERVSAGVDLLASQVEELMEVFCEDFGMLRNKKVEDYFEIQEGKSLVESAYEAIVAKLSPEDKKLLNLELLLKGWSFEPGESLADLVNGITRAHELVPVSVVSDIEAVGGRVFDSLVKLAR